MAIFVGKGITKQMYESLRPAVNWEKQYPKGGLFHGACFDDQGHLRITDVWESPGLMGEFVNERLVPAMQKLQIPPPAVEVFPLHNMNVYPAANGYWLK